MSQFLQAHKGSNQTNPFYAARRSRFSATLTNADIAGAVPRPSPVIRLPAIPKSASPVPRLTSLYPFDDAGQYGSRAYPGNCGGELIRDLLEFFKPQLVCDPMTGSGTCRDVCEQLRLPCVAWDIHQGVDACAAGGFAPPETFDFIWAHPPYWRQKLYSRDERDLSRAPTLPLFLDRYGTFLKNCASAVKPGGHVAILMGDYQDRELGLVPLTFHTKRLAFAAGLIQPHIDIVRFSHGATSSRKTYRTSFIPCLHDVCMVFRRRV
jgi:hypothetical protein